MPGTADAHAAKAAAISEELACLLDEHVSAVQGLCAEASALLAVLLAAEGIAACCRVGSYLSPWGPEPHAHVRAAGLILDPTAGQFDASHAWMPAAAGLSPAGPYQGSRHPHAWPIRPPLPSRPSLGQALELLAASAGWHGDPAGWTAVLAAYGIAAPAADTMAS